MKEQNRLSILITVIATAVLCCTEAYAGTGELQAGFMDLYGALRVIFLACGAVALGFCGVVMIIGSEQEAQRAKTAIKYIIVAAAAVILLPAVISFGKGMFGSSWNPQLLG